MEPGDRLHFDITKKYKNKGCREKYKKRDKYRRNGAASKSKVKGSFNVLHNSREENMATYGYCRVSTHSQRIERQETNIREKYPQAVI